MFADLDKLRLSAIESYNNCTEKQKALKEGDLFITEAYELAIFNQILDPEDGEEFGYDESAGYMMVRAWSNACPEGEMGSVHRSRAIAKIIDSDRYTAQTILSFILSIWDKGGYVDQYDLQWISNAGNLEVLV